MVHGVVSAHAGEIDVQTAPGRGTSISTGLPAAAPESDPTGASQTGHQRVDGQCVPEADDPQ